MPSLTERKDIVYANVNVQIPNSLKMKAKILKVNLTQATIAGITAEVEKAEQRFEV
jgi:post-segregation antitoxin (ccd killing protein)